jgi:plasmid stabilization system protein ParE
VSRRYQLTATAQQGIDEIGAFIAEDSVDAALKVYDALEEAFELLAEPTTRSTSARQPTCRFAW